MRHGWLVLLLIGGAALGECMGPNGPVDCGQIGEILDKANRSGSKRKRIECLIRVMPDVLTQAENCGKLTNRDACRAKGAQCTWTRGGKCGGYYLEDCKVQAASSRLLCTEQTWVMEPPKCDGSSRDTSVDCFVCEPHPSNALRRTHKGT